MLLTVTQSVPAAPDFGASLTPRIPWFVKFPRATLHASHYDFPRRTLELP